MSRRWRGVVLAAAVLLVPAPMVLGVPPASATTTQDHTSAQLTFDSYGQTVTCTVNNSSTHDGGALTARAFGTSTGSGEACSTDDLITVTVTAKDENGRSHSGTAQGYSSGISEVLDHASSGVTTKVYVYFNDCDSPVCGLTVTAAPK